MVKLSPIRALRRTRGSITDRSRIAAGARYPAGVRRPGATFLTIAALAATAGVAPAADGAPPRPQAFSARSLLWATVNDCDTTAQPDTIGIRGSMPGSGYRRQEMYMRFQLQYLATDDDGKWHNIGDAGDSGWIDVGSARYRQRQTGRNFTVRPPDSGSFRLRGAVTFEWRDGTEVVRRARVRTTAGHGNTAGADPRGYSRASCVVTK
jgi:hypothetical protein